MTFYIIIKIYFKINKDFNKMRVVKLFVNEQKIFKYKRVSLLCKENVSFFCGFCKICFIVTCSCIVLHGVVKIRNTTNQLVYFVFAKISK